MGIPSQANDVRARVSEAASNAISVRIELQADCCPGIRARHVEEEFGTLEPGDVEEAINAARRIGGDTLQRNACRVPMPHIFKDGTSEQRQRRFATGYRTCDLPMPFRAG
jgi:predicted metalloprotease